jgi:hypothetical protein
MGASFQASTSVVYLLNNHDSKRAGAPQATRNPSGGLVPGARGQALTAPKLLAIARLFRLVIFSIISRWCSAADLVNGRSIAVLSIPKTAVKPVLALLYARKGALLDEFSASPSWLSLFEELVEQIRDGLERAAESAKALLVEGSTAEPPPAAAQADAL